MYTVASPDPNECHSTLLSETRGEMLTPNPNECDSTLTSVTGGSFPLPPYLKASGAFLDRSTNFGVHYVQVVRL